MSIANIENIRVLNKKGIGKFGDFIKEEILIRGWSSDNRDELHKKTNYESSENTPHFLLESNEFSEDLKIDGKFFKISKNMRKFALYSDPVASQIYDYIQPLIDIFDGIDWIQLENNDGLYDAIALYYFDKIQPGSQTIDKSELNDNDIRNICSVRSIENYSISEENAPTGNRINYYRHRHRIYTNFKLWKLHGEHPSLLRGNSTVRGDVIEQATGSTFLNEELLKVFDFLYCDKETQTKMVPGSGGSKRGSPRYLRKFINNILPMTYFVQGMTYEEIMAVLPERQFKKFM